MRYVYFISYVANHVKTVGYCTIEYERKIKSYENLEDIVRIFEKEFDMKETIILNYKLLRRKLW